MSKDNLGQILVVDDEVELKNALVETLNAQGYDAVGYTSGDDALTALRGRNFDVLLSDLMMPKMDGIALLGAALEIDPQLLCVIMTGQGTIQTAVDAMRVGAFDYLLKPFRLHTLMPTLARAMNVRRLRMENLQLRETVAIHELSQTISFTFNPQTVIDKLADAAMQQSEADEVSVLLPTPEGDELYVAAVRGENRARLLGERAPLEESISSWVARERTPLLLEGQVKDERFSARWPRPDIRSAISVPLQVAGKLIGVLNINSVNRLRPFTPGQMKALTILASAGAAALEGSALYDQALRAEQNYRSIFENAIEGIFQSTLDGRFIKVNPSMARILGYESPEEMMGAITDEAQQLYVDPERRVESLRLQKEAGVLQGFEFEAYRKDGAKIWLSMNRRSVRDEQGAELYREGSIEEITERKRAEQQIHLQATALKAAANGIVITNAQGSITWVNPAFTALTGYTFEEALGRNPRILKSGKHDKDFYKKMWETIKSGQVWHGDLINRHKDGSLYFEEQTVTPVLNEAGEILHFIAIKQDVTRRKRAEEENARLTAEIEAERQRLSNIIANVPGAVWESWGAPDAATQRMNYVSDYVETLSGYTVEEWLSAPLFWLSIVHPDDKKRAAREAAANFASRKCEPLIFRLLTKNGETIWVESHYSFIYDSENNPLGTRGVTFDITERKNAEEELRVSEEKLRQSQKLEAVGQLAGGVAHDFNNLLTVINGYSDLLMRKLEKDNPTRLTIEEIRKAGERAASLTRQLLAFSRRQVLQPAPLELNVIVANVDKMLRRLIGEDIDLLMALEPELGRIKADPGQIEQVLLNLAVNARDAMPQGGKLTIETSNVYLDNQYAQTHPPIQPGQYVMLAVSDNGFGMSPETQARIFEPFFTTKEQGKGTGLGLSTVYGIVKQSGGNVWVYSEEGRGTTFKVYLPRVDEQGETTEAVELPAELARGRETILLAEDEEQVRRMAQTILEMYGYRVLEASNGEEATSIFKERGDEIHLVLTDAVMPQMSGPELAQRLMTLRPDIKVLYMSGYTDDAIVRHGLIEHEIAFLQKPFTAEALIRKVREALDAPREG
jgi:PAS domain S-box-containing protein